LKFEPAQVKVPTKTIGQEALELARQAYEESIPTGAIDALIYKRTDITLSSDQLQSVRTALRNQTYLTQNPGTTIADARNSTAADRLLSNVFASPTTSCTVLFSRHDSPLLATGGGGGGTKLMCKTKDRNGIREVDVTDALLHAEGISPEARLENALDHANKVRESLSITGSGMILLGFAWTNDEARRLFEMYPEFHTGDVTEKTNAENRPLMMLCGKTAENQTFTSTWIYMPSKCRWVFDWIFDKAMPILHRLSTLARMNLMCTDQDDKEYGATTVCLL